MNKATALLVATSALLSGCDNSPEARAKRHCADETMAFVMSQGFVRARLRSPASAEFPYLTDRQTSSFALGDCRFHVASWVDAQNAFGGTVRTNYSLKIRYVPARDAWEASDVVMR